MSISVHIGDGQQIKVILKDDPACRTLTKERVLNYLMRMDSVFSAKKEFRIIYDTRQYTGTFPLTCLMIQAKYMMNRQDETRKYMKRCGVLVKSPLARAAIKTLFTLRKPSVENYLITDDVAKCVKFMAQ
jgi:hypothetical protein